MMKKEIREEIEYMAPGLLEIGNRNPYKVPPSYFDDLRIDFEENQSVPNNYFENLSDQILEELSTKKSTNIFVLNRKIWTAAASIVLLCTVSFYTMFSNQSNENDLFVMDIKLDEAIEYLESNDELYMDDVYDLSDAEWWEDVDFESQEDEDLESLLEDVTLDELNDLLQD